MEEEKNALEPVVSQGTDGTYNINPGDTLLYSEPEGTQKELTIIAVNFPKKTILVYDPKKNREVSLPLDPTKLTIKSRIIPFPYPEEGVETFLDKALAVVEDIKSRIKQNE